VIPMPWIRRITAIVLLGFGAYTIVAAING
jgi:hypothetical protein